MSKTFSAVFARDPQRSVAFKLRGVCQFDVLNPCWDNRTSDVPGKHWGGVGDACPACTEAAAKAGQR